MRLPFRRSRPGNASPEALAEREALEASPESWPPEPHTGAEDAEVQSERERASRRKGSWELEEGAEIAPGRTALRRLGGGNRYEVYLVWDEVLFAICVAKLLRPDQVEDPHGLDDLRHEAEILDALAHPVLVRGFDAVLEGPRPHVLIEHFEGPALRRLIRKGGPLPVAQALPLALHVAAALQYMSREGFVHLDVKPDNIIMGVPPRLIDLSVARSLERAARTRGAVGTDAYMAPEQCGSGELEGLIGPSADVWGLAATLYHAVVGSVPFPRERGAARSSEPMARFPQLVRDPEPLPGHVPGELRDVLEQGLAHDPGERPTAAELVERLEPLLATLPSKLVLAPRGTKFR